MVQVGVEVAGFMVDLGEEGELEVGGLLAVQRVVKHLLHRCPELLCNIHLHKFMVSEIDLFLISGFGVYRRRAYCLLYRNIHPMYT